MAYVTGILCGIVTANIEGAGTDGRVYLGIGGREFRLASTAPDFERGSGLVYIMGKSPDEPNPPPPQIRVLNGEQNDPQVGHGIDARIETVPPTPQLYRSPVYIRFEPLGDSPDWCLRRAFVNVYTGQGQFVIAFLPPSSNFDYLWLGDRYGKIVFLTETSNQPQP
jgi:hypothetical protein